MEKLGRFALERVSHELQDPSRYEQNQGENPEAMVEESGNKNGQRNQNRGNAKGVAQPIDRVLMAARIARNPLFTAVRPQHGARK